MLHKIDRNETWCQMYRDGKSGQEIADAYGVTRERVYQILRRGNLIERRVQRRQLAKEMIAQDRLDVRAAKDELDAKLVELVQSGLSIATAAGKVGFTVPQAVYVCKKAGAVSLHGRWHDFSERKARFTQLVEAGVSVNRAREIVGSEEGREIGYEWVWKNCPQLIKKNRPKHPIEVLAVPPKVERAPRSPIESHPPLDWDDERRDRLVKLWFSGASSQQISDIFGDCSRNAVIGQIHRLRVAGKLQSPSRTVE